MATFFKLRDGSWGLRMAGPEARRALDGPAGTVNVTVTRRDESTVNLTVGRVVHLNRRLGVLLTEIWHAPTPAPVVNRTPAPAPVLAALPSNPVTVAALLGNDEPTDDGTFSLDGTGDDDATPTPPADPVPEPIPGPPAEPVIDTTRFLESRPWMLFYDIPDKSNLSNPSGFLYGRAIRLNLSCWVVAEGDIPYGLIDNLRRGGANAFVIPVDPRGAKVLMREMTDSLRKEIAAALVRCNRSAANVDAKIADAANTSRSADEADEWVRKRADDVVERMGELLKNIESAAARFGIETDGFRFDAVANTARNIRDAMMARAAVYAEAVRTARAAGIDPTVVNAAAADNLPAGVLADALREAGETGSADALGAAFDDNA